MTMLGSERSNAAAKEYDERRRLREQEQKAAHILTDFRKRWCNYLGIPEINFECSTQESNYITRPQDAVLIQTAISWALDGKRCALFIDAFACVGGDTLAAMNEFRQAEIHSIQQNTNEEEADRCGRLTRNIRSIEQSFTDRRKLVVIHEMNIRDFILTGSDGQQITVLYLDPPWALGPDSSSISPPAVVNHFLNGNVWHPLRQRRMTPELIVIKLPGYPTQVNVENWPRLRNQYTQVACITPRDKYAVYILRRIDH